MSQEQTPDKELVIAEDERTLHKLGYAQELARVLGGFSNFAISLSIICILAGGLTSFHLGYCSVGGASIGYGWPLVCLFSLAVAAAMGHIASAFPTAGGLYHWASILGGRGLGWATAWFNLAGLITVLAAINVGTILFATAAFFPGETLTIETQILAVSIITGLQALVNHLGIRVTRILTDFSGYWILFVSLVLAWALYSFSNNHDLGRLFEFTNFSGLPEGDKPVWPRVESLGWLFALGFLLPAYTITGFDASAHASEETVGAARNVPNGIVRSVLVSGIFGWLLLTTIVLAIKDPLTAAKQGENVFVYTLGETVPKLLYQVLCGAIVLAQFLCGLATVTSASRMMFAFARDGGLPGSHVIRRVSPTFKTPPAAIWLVAGLSVLFTVYTPIYSTITAVCVIFLYISYVMPTAIGLIAWGRWWKEAGPWSLGIWFRPLAILSVLGCIGLIVIGMQPPNHKAAIVVGGMIVVLLALWFGVARQHFPGPPHLQGEGKP